MTQVKLVFLSIPYHDALFLCGGLRKAEGCVSYGINMPEAEKNKTSKTFFRRTEVYCSMRSIYLVWAMELGKKATRIL